jgi:surface antigen
MESRRVRGACEDRYRPGIGFGEALRLLAVGVITLSAGACSLTYSFASLDADEPETTASIAPKTAVSPLSPDLNEEDWRRAKAAMGVALDPQGAGTQVSWDNPETSRKGAFTPSGAPFVKNDDICRSFSAQVHEKVPTAPTKTLQGTACRPSGGEWAITELKPADGKPTDAKAPDTKPAKTARKA